MDSENSSGLEQTATRKKSTLTGAGDDLPRTVIVNADAPETKRCSRR